MNQLKKLVDEVVIPETPDLFRVVSEAYDSCPTVTDDEALALLEKWKKEKSPRSRPQEVQEINQ